MTNVAKLYDFSYSIDDIGNSTPTATETEIFVEERSVSHREWADGGVAGIKADCVLVTPFMNYNGQEEVEYEGTVYSIYRTYKAGDNVELYLTRKGGTYEASQSDQ